MNQKGSVWVFILTIILSLLAIGGGIFWAQKINKDVKPEAVVTHLKQIADTEKIADQSQEDISNWKTYTNTKYGFEFRYPNNWKVSDDARFSFIQLQGVKDGKVDAINGGITIVDKSSSSYSSTYRKMFVSDTECPVEAGKIDLSDTINVYCFTGKDITTDAAVWKAVVECSASQFYGQKINPENCPHQFWRDTKDFFYVVHFNFFEPILKGSKDDVFFKQFLSTFKFN